MSTLQLLPSSATVAVDGTSKVFPGSDHSHLSINGFASDDVIVDNNKNAATPTSQTKLKNIAHDKDELEKRHKRMWNNFQEINLYLRFAERILNPVKSVTDADGPASASGGRERSRRMFANLLGHLGKAKKVLEGETVLSKRQEVEERLQREAEQKLEAERKQWLEARKEKERWWIIIIIFS
jgi:hypothetical protein